MLRGDFWHGVVVAALHLLLEFFEFFLALVRLLLLLSLLLFGLLDVDLELVAQIVGEFELVYFSVHVLTLPHHFEVIQEEASLGEFDVATESTREAEANLFQIEVSERTRHLLGVETLPKIPGNIFLTSLKKRTELPFLRLQF